MNQEKILIWLPSPMGDAIMATPALKAIRKHFADAEITFFANSVTQQLLSPSDLCDSWLEAKSTNPFSLSYTFKKYRFGHVILFKNSFS